VLTCLRECLCSAWPSQPWNLLPAPFQPFPFIPPVIPPSPKLLNLLAPPFLKLLASSSSSADCVIDVSKILLASCPDSKPHHSVRQRSRTLPSRSEKLEPMDGVPSEPSWRDCLRGERRARSALWANRPGDCAAECVEDVADESGGLALPLPLAVPRPVSAGWLRGEES